MITRWFPRPGRAGWRAGAALLLSLGTIAAEPPRPNLLWITAEDIGLQLGSYGDAFARTPRLDAFARESVRDTHAFATAPVCSPARSCLLTGLYATSLGTQRLRSQFPIPQTMRGFPAWLRASGYYTANTRRFSRPTIRTRPRPVGLGRATTIA